MYVLGIDEAGRGPLAGPVAVGVVLAPKEYDILAMFPGLNDSKKLSEKRRKEIYLKVQEEVEKGNIRARVCLSSEKIIDAYGISRAVKSALVRGVRNLAPQPDDAFVYLDGLLHAPKEYEQETVEGGDSKIPAIMLASVVAKVVRDRVMVTLSETYPDYGFEKHKGYGTKAHQEAIRMLGLSPVHRRTYCKNFA